MKTLLKMAAVFLAAGLALGAGFGQTTSSGAVAYCGGVTGGSIAPTYPVTIPSNATAYASLEKQSGWTTNADSSIAPNPPSAYSINPAGGGGSTMTLSTTGTAGLYTGWMANIDTHYTGLLHSLLRVTFEFDNVAPIQAWETGRRYTNANGITDNGETEFDDIHESEMGFNINTVGASWTPTGCKFPPFAANKLYTEELYWVSGTDGDLSLEYVELNGTVCVIPASLQNIAGHTLSWTKNEAVMAWQPDTTTSAATYNAVVTMSYWVW